MKLFLKIFTITFTLFVCLLLSGAIEFEKYIPPIGKLLFPKTGLWQSAENFTPDFTLKHPSLKSEVQILYDERGVPHIYAQNTEDALLAQGYVEARDRLFQMDITSRSASGRLAEILGTKFVDIDERTLNAGMKWAADKAIASWKKSDRYQELTPYIDGVNLWIDQLKERQHPFEFKLLNYAPQTWTAENCAHIQKSMARVLCYGSNDIAYSNMRTIIGDSLFNKLYPDRNKLDVPIVPAGTPYAAAIPLDSFDNSLNVIDTFTFEERIKSPKGAGSNNWAVNAAKTKNGFPILANDPHLNLSYPSIWYELQITTPEYSTRGVSIPGMPGIMIGFNEHLAWGETNVGQDIKDFYQIKYLDDSREKYLIDGEVHDIVKIRDTIKVRGAEDQILETHYTKWGPIVYFSKSKQKDLALYWLAHEALNENEAFTFVDALASKNYDEYRAATSGFITPAQNFLVATREDDIGIEINGLFPAKQADDGKFVKDGSNSMSGWTEYIPEDQKAEVKNPSQNYVASANQWSTASDYPYYYTSRGFENYRGRIINRYLSDSEELTTDHMKDFQLDNFNIKAEELNPFLLSSIQGKELNKTQQAWQELLKNWDYIYNADQEAPVIFEKWFREYRRKIMSNIMDASDRMTVKTPASFVIADLSLNHPEDELFDDPLTEKVESASDLALTIFKSIQAGNMKENWGLENELKINHIARISGLGSNAMHIGGSGDVLNAMRGSFGPSWRMIVELGDTINAYGIFPGGQSGNPTSKLYDNNTEMWSKGEYYKLKLLSKEELSETQSLQITLNPKDE